MLQQIHDLPAGILGIDAIGQVTAQDYETVLKPLVEDAYRSGRKMRYLYRLGHEFQGLSPGAAWQDMELGLRYLRLFERIAIVTDREWIRHAAQMLGSLIPCPVQVYRDTEYKSALNWLTQPEHPRHLVPRLLTESGVLQIEVNGSITKDDFNDIAAKVDPWLEANHELHGVVVHAAEFPGWENFGSFLNHMTFVSEHHRRIGRVAIAADGAWAGLAPALAKHFLAAEVRHFSYDEIGEAQEWAAKGEAKAAAARRSAQDESGAAAH